MPVEREIKLRFESAAAARSALQALGARPLHERRLQDDVLLDSPDSRLQRAGCTLRLRRDGDRAAITWKGPVIAGPMKTREEVETAVGLADDAGRILHSLGFVPRFRYQKFREELSLEGLIVAIDETPIGTFVELEGEEAAITSVAGRLGRGPADYVLASYRSLFLEHRQTRGGHGADMVFDSPA
ncbi:MAG: class IV adenylate cyclase [Vicinamibacteraceae bacterium]